jgi:large conductance mechanosensitive channel
LQIPSLLVRTDDVALGMIIGTAFSGVVTSLVSDILLPPIVLLSPNATNLANQFWVLKQGETADLIYNTLEQAAADGMSHTNSDP